MVSDTEQLTIDFEKVQSTLEVYPGIRVIQVEGQPPDSYDIEYRLKGYVQDSDGRIQQASQHRIRVNLPFGYPHFPPTVKLLSPIFHPDIDPDAIRITVYWQQNPSLPDLILHIGEMICGNIYNLEDPFNQEAADWYAEHRDELPLDCLQAADIEPETDQQAALNDDDFDLLGLEDKELIEAPASSDQLDMIRLRIEQKEMIAANRLLADIPKSPPVPDRDEIEHVISSALSESKKLLNQAEKLEKEGNIDKALETIERVAEIAADIPEVADIRLRLQQLQVMTETFSTTTEIQESSSSSSHQESIISAESSEKGDKKSTSKTRAPRISIPCLPVKSILTVTLLLTLVGGGAIFYVQDRSALKKAEDNWQQARNHVRKKQFQDAAQSAQTARSALKKVRILRSQKKELQAGITKLLNSTAFKKGLQGQVKYNQQYLPAETVSKLEQQKKLTEQLKTLTAAAENVARTGTVDQAVAAYDQALKFARQNNLPTQVRSLNQAINKIRLEEAMANARKAESAKDWKNAAATYRQALALSKTLSNNEGSREISKKLVAATFRHELDQSRTTFAEAKWQQSIEMLENAKKLLHENPDSVSPGERRELDLLLADAHLYQILSLARQAYENHALDTAIKEYQRSLDLLTEQQQVLAGTHDNAVAKIKKTMLMIKIAREQDAATTAEQNNDLQTALAHYKKIEELITSSGFTEDHDLMTIEKKVLTQIKDKSAQLALESRVHWLQENFKNIFNDAYPSSRSSQLSHPKVTFIKEEQGKQIFNMTCVERSQGTSFRLEVKYQYSPANGTWSIYYDQ